MKYYTTIEQSKKLLELGLNPETSDMGYNGVEDRDIRKIRYDNVATTMPNIDSIPCWSLGALLEVIPFPIQTTTSYKNARVDIIYKKEIENSLHTETAETLLEALLQTICWLLENGYIKKASL